MAASMAANRPRPSPIITQEIPVKRHLVAALSVAVLAALQPATAANEPFKSEVKARQGLMQVYAFNLGTLAAMAKGNKPYDADAAAAAANNLKLATQMKNGGMWPKGSSLADPEMDKRTDAKPEIWEAGSKIGERSKALGTAVASLAQSAGNGLDALKAGVGETGKACKGCHDDYRRKR
ncbi:MAG: cytochrome c [Burkholderiaceae bacterium]